jgi:hypothetical protein
VFFDGLPCHVRCFYFVIAGDFFGGRWWKTTKTVRGTRGDRWRRGIRSSDPPRDAQHGPIPKDLDMCMCQREHMLDYR